MQVPPSDNKVDEECSPDELAKERARLTAELADAKKKFMAVAKRKQQEYSKKVNSLPAITVTVADALQGPVTLASWQLVFCQHCMASGFVYVFESWGFA